MSTVLPSPNSVLQIPLNILRRRMITHGTNVVLQVLVQLSNVPVDLAAWEDEVALKQRFPRASTWSHAGSQRGGIVTNCDDLGSVGDIEAGPMKNGRGKRTA